LNVVLLQYLRDNLRHRQMLENPLVGAQRQITQLRYDAQRIAGQALAGFALGDLISQPMNAQPIRAKGEKGRLMQQALQVEIRLLANQFNLEAIGLADGSHLASGDAKCVLG
jgi:hypothetical protein